MSISLERMGEGLSTGQVIGGRSQEGPGGGATGIGRMKLFTENNTVGR